MIITKEIEIFVHNTKVKYYKNIGYNVKKGGDIIVVKVKDLPLSSHYKVVSKCDFCGSEYNINYEKYILNEKRNNGFYSCKKCRSENSSKTKKIKYGDAKYCNKEKIKETLMEKYGNDSPMRINEFKEKQKKKMEDLGLRPKPEERTNWKNYRIEVNNITYGNKKLLLKKWDGHDYYDKKYIKDNFNSYKPTDAFYPTIDHKISILYGFINKISPKIIGDISNLCITKKCNNSAKGSKNDDDFILILDLASNLQDNKHNH